MSKPWWCIFFCFSQSEPQFLFMLFCPAAMAVADRGSTFTL